MRMWKIDPKLLCRKHLLGEHVEMHMFAGTLNKNKSLKGYIDKGLVEVHNIKNRHEELAKELIRRGYNHKSELNLKVPLYKSGFVNVGNNINDLSSRCEECRKKLC